jgi:hypothetical protein
VESLSEDIAEQPGRIDLDIIESVTRMHGHSESGEPLSHHIRGMINHDDPIFRSKLEAVGDGWSADCEGR